MRSRHCRTFHRWSSRRTSRPGHVHTKHVLFSMSVSSMPKPSCIRSHIRTKTHQFWSSKLSKYKGWGNYKEGINGDNGVKTASRVEPDAPTPHTPDRKAFPSLKKVMLTISDAAECHNSQSMARDMSTSGLAIIDTGASRSVIGSDLVPAVLQKFPPSIRSHPGTAEQCWIQVW